jgi:DNA-directed RNA polymerase I subunit RPA1
MACPGDSVGAIAGQSFGEPSTQMTLNTFHLAGHGGANVTLGIPRLRELLSTKNIKNPMMILPFKESQTKKQIDEFLRAKQKVTLLQLVRAVELEEELVCFDSVDNALTSMGASSKRLLKSKDRFKKLIVRLEYEDQVAMKQCFGIDYQKINELVLSRFVTLFSSVLRKLMKTSKSKSVKNQNMMKNLMEEIEKEEEKVKPKQKSEKKKTKTEGKEEDLGLIEEDDDEDDDGESIQDLELERNKNKQTSSEPIQIEDEFIADIQPVQESNKKVVLNPEGENKLLHLSTFDGNQLDLEFHVPLNLKRTLFMPIVEQLLEKVSIREIQNIKKFYLITNTEGGKEQWSLQTEGINFPWVWGLPQVFDVDRIESNDVQEIANVFGIEAGRNCLAQEVNKVFSHYGIAVDFRHMSLVADHMSFSGELRPLSRMGMQHAQSPLLKMSFETSMNFLIKACENKDFDNLNTASGNIVVGELMKNGTGAFDIIDCTSQIN